jgi:hypothetical protein
MKTFLTACVVVTALGFSAGAPAKADVVVRTPGVAVEQGSPYWRHDYHDWQAQREFRDREYQREAWQRDHCVRDWSGAAYCRR